MKTLFLTVSFLILCTIGRAAVVLDSQDGGFSHSYQHGLPDGEREEDTVTEGSGHAAVVRQLAGISDGNAWSSSVTILQASSTAVITDEDRWLQVQIDSSIVLKTGATGAGAAEASASDHQEFTFTISGEDEICLISGSFVQPENSAGVNHIILEREDEGIWTPVILNSTNPEAGETVVEMEGNLAPGNYRFRLRFELAAESPSATEEMSASAKIFVSVGAPPAAPPLHDHPAASVFPYWSYGLKATLDHAPLLETNRVDVVSFSPAEDGNIDVAITVGVINQSPTPWSAPEPKLAPTHPDGPDLEPLEISSASHGIVVPGESAFSPRILTHFRTSIATLPDLLAQLANFERISWSGDQHPTFIKRIQGGGGTPLGYLGYLNGGIPSIHKWPAVPGFVANPYEYVGDMILYNTKIYSHPGMNPELRLMSDSRAHTFPLHISNDPRPGAEDPHFYVGTRAVLPSYMIDGTLTIPAIKADSYPDVSTSVGQYPRFPIDGKILDIEESDIIENLSRPIHFNRIELSDFVEMHGSFALRPVPLSFEITMSGGELQRFVIESGIQADVNLLVNIKAPGDNTGDAPGEQEKRIVTLPLFTAPLPIGIIITPTLTLDVGASVSATQELTIPVTTGVDTTVKMIWENGETTYEQTSTPVLPRISDPTVFEEVSAKIEAWISARLALVISHETGLASGAPTIGARARAKFDLQPFSDPWWTLEGDLDITAGLEARIAGLFHIVDTERTLSSNDVFSIDAGGPLLAASSNVTRSPPSIAPLNPGIRPIGGAETRWVRGYRAKINTTLADSAFIVPAIGSDDVFIGGSSGGSREIARITPEGGLRWMLTDAPVGNTFRPYHAVAEPHGGITVVGSSNNLSLIQYDADGQFLWNSSQAILGEGISGYIVRRILRRDDGAGSHHYWVIGDASVSPIRKHPLISRFDADGNLLWHKLLTQAETYTTNASANDAMFASDGNIIIAGSFIEKWEPGDDLALINRNGLLWKIDPETAATIWMTPVLGTRGTEYYAVAEDPGGNLYLGGRHSVVTTDDNPSALISKFTAEGQHEMSRLVGHTADQKGLLFPSEHVPSNGGTFWDQFNALLWADNSLWAVGQIGLTNLPEGSQGSIARFDSRLQLTRYASYNGPSHQPSGIGGQDRFLAIADGGNGILAISDSMSFLPWPAGDPDSVSPFMNARMLFKFPWEGFLRFHDLSAGRRADPFEKRGMTYIYPSVYNAAAALPRGFPAFTPVHNNLLPLVTDRPDLPIHPSINLTLQEPFEYRALEYIPPGRIDSLETYLSWNQISAGDTDNPDGDDLSDTLEMIFGTDPWKADTLRQETGFGTDENGGSYLTLGFPRSHLARDLDLMPAVEGSRDLLDWVRLTDVPFSATALDPQREWLQFIVPVPDGGEDDPDQYFLRLAEP